MWSPKCQLRTSSSFSFSNVCFVSLAHSHTYLWVAVGASIRPAFCLSWLDLFGLCAARILDIFSYSLCLAFQSLFHLSGLYFWKCDSTPGIILQQFNIMSDVRIFRRGQLMHISCINHLVVAAKYSASSQKGSTEIHIELYWSGKLFCARCKLLFNT